MDEELRDRMIKRVIDRCRIRLSIDVNDDYNKAYASGMHDAFRALDEAGVDGLKELTTVIPELYAEVDKTNKQTRGVIN